MNTRPRPTAERNTSAFPKKLPSGSTRVSGRKGPPSSQPCRVAEPAPGFPAPFLPPSCFGGENPKELPEEKRQGGHLLSSTCRCDISSPSRLCLTHVWLEATPLRVPGPHSSASTVGSGEQISGRQPWSRIPRCRPDGAGQGDVEEAGQENEINLTTHLHISILRCNRDDGKDLRAK